MVPLPSAPLPCATVIAIPLLMGLLLTAAAAWAGGASVAVLRLGHRRMQVLLSFTGGILLGVAFLHLLPHAATAFGGRVDEVSPWLIGGFFLMFLLERAFHGHAHHAADPEHGPPVGCDHGHEPHDGHGSATGHDRHPGTRPGWEWCGAFAGLAVHSLADGAALAAAMDVPVAGGSLVTGLATLLAILLHKPIDAALIAALMLKAGSPAKTRRIVNAAHALLVPLGAALFLVMLRGVGDERGVILGAAMGLATGAFVCIAAADLLPEVEFHSHDRLLLSATLALGITVAAGITALDREFAVRGRAGGIRTPMIESGTP